MVNIGDRVVSSVVRRCDDTRPELEVISISEPGATGWVGLSPDEDRLVTVRAIDTDEIFEIFIDTIYS